MPSEVFRVFEVFRFTKRALAKGKAKKPSPSSSIWELESKQTRQRVLSSVKTGRISGGPKWVRRSDESAIFGRSLNILLKKIKQSVRQCDYLFSPKDAGQRAKGGLGRPKSGRNAKKSLCTKSATKNSASCHFGQAAHSYSSRRRSSILTRESLVRILNRIFTKESLPENLH